MLHLQIPLRLFTILMIKEIYTTFCQNIAQQSKGTDEIDEYMNGWTDKRDYKLNNTLSVSKLKPNNNVIWMWT